MGIFSSVVAGCSNQPVARSHIAKFSTSTFYSQHAAVTVPTHLVCFSTLYCSTFLLQLHFREHFHISTPTLIGGCTAVSTLPDVYIRLYLASSLHSTYHTCFYVYACLCGLHSSSSAAHHLPCFQGGKECMATLHSSYRDFTLLYVIFYISRTFS
jgi:hypothetical protein